MDINVGALKFSTKMLRDFLFLASFLTTLFILTAFDLYFSGLSALFA